MWTCVGLAGGCWRDRDGEEQGQKRQTQLKEALGESALTVQQVRLLAAPSEDRYVIRITHVVGLNHL